MSDTATKHCYRCRQDKPVTDFYSNKANPSGYHTMCKECDKARKRAQYAADPDYRRYYIDYASRWNADNPDAHLRHNREYRRRNPDKARAWRQAYKARKAAEKEAA